MLRLGAGAEDREGHVLRARLVVVAPASALVVPVAGPADLGGQQQVVERSGDAHQGLLQHLVALLGVIRELEVADDLLALEDRVAGDVLQEVLLGPELSHDGLADVPGVQDKPGLVVDLNEARLHAAALPQLQVELHYVPHPSTTIGNWNGFIITP